MANSVPILEGRKSVNNRKRQAYPHNKRDSLAFQRREDFAFAAKRIENSKSVTQLLQFN